MVTIRKVVEGVSTTKNVSVFEALCVLMFEGYDKDGHLVQPMTTREISLEVMDGTELTTMIFTGIEEDLVVLVNAVDYYEVRSPRLGLTQHNRIKCAFASALGVRSKDDFVTVIETPKEFLIKALKNMKSHSGIALETLVRMV